MRQVAVRAGTPIVIDVPAPEAIPGHVLISVSASCISTGTELTAVSRQHNSLLKRALANPYRAMTIATDTARKGMGAIWKKVFSELTTDFNTIGYSIAGVVIDVGGGVESFPLGSRVAASGFGFANHAEYVAVPRNLVVRLPDQVPFTAGSTVALGAIALQAVRRADAKLGEFVLMIGCGAIGLIALQMLVASGCRVAVAELDDRRLNFAKQFGAELAINPSKNDVCSLVNQWSDGCGVDVSIIFASTTSSAPVSMAFGATRRKGRVVLAGVAGNEYEREEWYAKEIDFLISTSYGPGRYDAEYELKGVDYPYAYVRWTENRNMRAYMNLLERGRVNVDTLIEVQEIMDNATHAYELLKDKQKPILAVLTSSNDPSNRRNVAETVTVETKPCRSPQKSEKIRIGVIGSGSFVKNVHLPLLTRKNMQHFDLAWCCSRSGINATNIAAASPGCRATTRLDEVLSDPDLHAVLIATRHDSHAEIAEKALYAGKAVFLEKPMCLTSVEFETLQIAVTKSRVPFHVGYNRRFSPFAAKIRKELKDRLNPLMINYTVNAGYLPLDHWTQGAEGGGRLLGEACHMIDLFRFLVGAPAVSMTCSPIRSSVESVLATDNFCIAISYTDGSVANLVYSSQGSRLAPKERMEVFADNQLILLDDYSALTWYGRENENIRLKEQDKGHSDQWIEFSELLRSGESQFIIPWSELSETWLISSQADSICRVGRHEVELV